MRMCAKRHSDLASFPQVPKSGDSHEARRMTTLHLPDENRGSPRRVAARLRNRANLEAMSDTPAPEDTHLDLDPVIVTTESRDEAAQPASPAQPMVAARKVDPMQGMKLEAILQELVTYFGWEEMGYRINIRCFNEDPSIGSSLKFLRKTPWARTKVDTLFLTMRAEQPEQSEQSEQSEPAAEAAQAE